MKTYRSRDDVPPLVRRAMRLAEQQGFEMSCSIEVGRLLRVLAGNVRSGVIGEMGTGTGVGSAWMAGVLRPDTSLVTVEMDDERASAAGKLLEPLPNVRVLHADWTAILEYGPFDLLFVDAVPGKRQEPERSLQALQLGGMVVLDDMTPEEQQTEELRDYEDPIRAFWLNDPRLAAAEILVSPAMEVILGTRVSE